MVSIYQKWSNEGTVVNQRQGNEWPRLIDVFGERNLARVDRFNRQGTVAQNAEKVNAGCNRRVSEHTVHHSLLHMGLQSCRLVHNITRFIKSEDIPVHHWKHQQWRRTEEKGSWFHESCFLLHHVDGRVCVSLTWETPGTRMRYVTRTNYLSIAADLSIKRYSLMSVDSFCRIMHLATKQNGFRNGLRRS